MYRKQALLISACLLGVHCRYDGGSNSLSKKYIRDLRTHFYLIPVCPEQLGGLATPRMPSEIQNDGSVHNREGDDVTAYFERGALAALRIAELNDCKLACMKEGSPSCGKTQIYDGTFTHVPVAGSGVTVKNFEKAQIKVYNEDEIERLKKENCHV
jgi:uncharacterized protein YbbK (DUF523 family)